MTRRSAESGPTNPRDRLAEIRVRQLATMTAGFDDGRPPRLVYRPGTDGLYQNDGANMLAELLTLRFHEDLASVFKRNVMDPIGRRALGVEMARTCTAARDGHGGLDELARVRVRHQRSPHRALARDRLPHLQVRGNGTAAASVLPGIRPGRDPADRPARLRPVLRVLLGQQRAVDVSRHAGRRLDKAARPGRQLWCWSARVSIWSPLQGLGVGSVKSQLPGGDRPEEWGRRVAGFFPARRRRPPGSPGRS